MSGHAVDSLLAKPVMADSSFLTFETLEKLSGWAGEQAKIFWRVLSVGPADYLRGQPASVPADTGIRPAVSFLAFVIAVCVATSTPLVFVFFNVDVFDYRIALCVTLPLIIAIVLFTGTAHCAAVALRGHGTLADTATGLFYGTVYLPFVYTLHYLTMMDPAFRAWLKVGDETAALPFSITLAVVASLSLVLTAYMAVKLVGVIRQVHRIGWIRGSLVILLAGIVYQAYEALVWMPFFAKVIAMKP